MVFNAPYSDANVQRTHKDNEIFISYSRRDKQFVQKLCQAFLDVGRDPWIDWEDIPKGEDWREAIAHGIQNADAFVFVISPDSVVSAECALEVEQAIQHNKRLLPIVYRDALEVHPALGAINWIFFREDNFDQAFQDLLKAIDNDLPHAQIHTRLLTRALEWDKKDRDPSFLLRGIDRHNAEQWLAQAEQKVPQPTPLHMQYILASGATEMETQRREMKRQRIWLGLVSGALIVAVALGIDAYMQRNRAIHNQQKAERREVEALNASSEAQLATGQSFDALLTALKGGMRLQQASWIRGEDHLRADTVSALQQALYQVRELNRLSVSKGSVYDVDFSPDGRLLVSYDDADGVKLWTVDGVPVTLGQDTAFQFVSFSSDGRMVAVVHRDGTAKLWQPDGTLVTSLGNNRASFQLIRFSPNGNALATLSTDSSGSSLVELWYPDGTPFPLGAEPSSLADMTFSASGRTIATLTRSGRVQLWDATGKETASFETIPGEASSVDASPTGSIILLSPDAQTIGTVNSDGTTQLWKADGTKIATLIQGQADSDAGRQLSRDGRLVSKMAFSPNGQTILTTAGEGEPVKLWNMDGTERATLEPGRLGAFLNFDYSPSGEFIATFISGQSNTNPVVKLWRADGTEVATLIGHTGPISAVRFSPNGQVIATSSDDATIRLWNTRGQLLSTLRGHRDWVTNSRFSPDGQTLATASYDGSVKLWNLGASPLSTLQSDITQFSPNGRWLITAIENGPVQLWQVGSDTSTTLIPQIDAPVYATFSPDDQFVAVSVEGQPVQLWRIDGTLIKPLNNTGGLFSDQDAHTASAVFSPDGEAIATLSLDGTLQLWKTDGTPLATILEQAAGVDISFSADGQTIATAEPNGKVRVWNLDGTPVATLHPRDAASDGASPIAAGVTFSPTGQVLATTLEMDGRDMVQLWQQDGTPISTLMDAQDPSGSSLSSLFVVFSPDGQWIATSRIYGEVQIWRTDGTLVKTIIPQSADYTRLMFSPDSQILATWSGETVQLWSVEGNLLATLNGHSAGISSVQFRPDSQMIATASWDQTFRLWSREGKPVTEFSEHQAGVTDIQFSADGIWLASVGDDRSVFLRPLTGFTDLDALLERGCQWVSDYLRTNPQVNEGDRHLCDP